MRVEDLQIQRNIYPMKPGNISPADFSRQSGSSKTESAQGVENFADVLNRTIGDNQRVKFSAHAVQRLTERDINLSPADLDRIEQGLKNVQEKGAHSSLLLLDDNAYIVSVDNRTVITAIAKEQTIGNVFTNIDSVAII